MIKKNGRLSPSVFLRLPCAARVKGIPQAVADEINTQDGNHNQQAGEKP
jgi:hypothetical protein